MNRRNFLGLVGAGLAAATFDPHRVIFDMGRKLWVSAPPKLTIIPRAYAGDAKTGSLIDDTLRRISAELPPDVRMAQWGGQVALPVYGSAGGIRVEVMAFLTRIDTDGRLWKNGMRFNDQTPMTEEYVRREVKRALVEMDVAIGQSRCASA